VSDPVYELFREEAKLAMNLAREQLELRSLLGKLIAKLEERS
jgi:hypothetical protein